MIPEQRLFIYNVIGFYGKLQGFEHPYIEAYGAPHNRITMSINQDRR